MQAAGLLRINRKGCELKHTGNDAIDDVYGRKIEKKAEGCERRALQLGPCMDQNGDDVSKWLP